MILTAQELPVTDEHPQTVTQPTDEQLLHRFRAGDRAALGTLAERHERELIGLAIGIIGGPAHRETALEAVQEAWLRVIRSARTFRGESTVKTWLYRITINAARDARARAVRHPSAADGSQIDPAMDSPDGDRLMPLRSAIDQLSDDQRLLVLLCYHRSLTHPQAAEVLGIPPGTLKSRLHAALTALRASLAQEARS